MATSYTLVLEFSPQDLQIIKMAGQRVTLARQVNGGPMTVAWLTFDPMMNNQISWEEDYSLYASSTEVRPGASIAKMSETPSAMRGASYRFEQNGSLTGPHRDMPVPPQAFAVRNDASPAEFRVLTFGLGQDVTVNGTVQPRAVIHAQPLMSNMVAMFEPSTVVAIWLSPTSQSGTIITPPPQVTVVRYEGNVTTATRHYDSKTGTFVE